ncbi:hypothetical protein BHM03_00028586 [Ensete ventricosum]|uniref:Uncharacterized protein n=1 Tax=Ensete ventricosum TaxID=4639 RepID=A0A426Z113_ENSVE|nr:hypothetical protein B296_00023335 [Ensete ventricosum]RZR73824.1 hypothetical protein BHM03_00028586 [Ensete ventricosum]
MVRMMTVQVEMGLGVKMLARLVAEVVEVGVGVEVQMVIMVGAEVVAVAVKEARVGEEVVVVENPKEVEAQ